MLFRLKTPPQPQKYARLCPLVRRLRLRGRSRGNSDDIRVAMRPEQPPTSGSTTNPTQRTGPPIRRLSQGSSGASLSIREVVHRRRCDNDLSACTSNRTTRKGRASMNLTQLAWRIRLFLGELRASKVKTPKRSRQWMRGVARRTTRGLVCGPIIRTNGHLSRAP